MTIRASAARDIERLVADLRDGPAARREAATARLRVIGARAIGRLSTLLDDGVPPTGRVAALRALDGMDDRRVVDLAITALADPDSSVVVAAIGVLRGWLTHESGTRAIEALTALALDTARDAAARLAVLDALSDLPQHVVQPLLQQLPASLRRSGTDQESGFEGAVDDPLGAREWLATHAAAPLSELHRFVTQASAGERDDATTRTKEHWRVTRGAAHLVLAQRGSRVALYDLREAYDAATGPLPLDFLTAVALVGDESCLEPMARAWAAAPEEVWWRDRLRDAAGDIRRRHRLTGRSAVVKRLRAKWPGFL